MKALEA